MNPVLRHLARTFRWPVLIVLSISLLNTGATNVTLSHNGDSFDGVISTPPPRWFLFIMAIVVATTFVRLYIAYGITRRDTVVAAAVLFGTLSVASVVVGRTVASVAGAISGSGSTMDSVAPSAGIGLLACLAWSVSGWLCGIGFVRFGVWGGLAFLAPALVPAAAAEVAGVATLTTAPLSPTLWIPVALVALGAGAWAVLALTRGVEVRRVLNVPA
jgi:hypothetical protein